MVQDDPGATDDERRRGFGRLCNMRVSSHHPLTFKSTVAALLLVGSAALGVDGGNPLVPNVGLADPHLHNFNGTFYLFATHDYR
jgi:hypothetical protein